MLGSIMYIIVIATFVVNTFGLKFQRVVTFGRTVELTINLDWSVLSFTNWKLSSNNIYLPVFMFNKTLGAWRIGLPMFYVTKITFK